MYDLFYCFIGIQSLHIWAFWPQTDCSWYSRGRGFVHRPPGSHYWW